MFCGPFGMRKRAKNLKFNSLQHDKLVMDLETLRYVQKKLLFEMNRYDLLESHDEPEHPLLDTFWHEVSGKWKDESFNQGGYKSGHHRFYKDWPTFK